MNNKIFSILLFLSSCVCSSQAVYSGGQTNDIFTQISKTTSVYSIAGTVYFFESETLSSKPIEKKNKYYFRNEILIVEGAEDLIVFNVLGQKIAESKSNNIDFRFIEKGVYFIRVNNNFVIKTINK